jgi:hypothetical protein
MFACEERRKLLKGWRDALMILADLYRIHRTCNLDKFDERYNANLRARQIANVKLVGHRAEHSC